METTDSKELSSHVYEWLRSHPKAFVQGDPTRGLITIIDGEFNLVELAELVQELLRTQKSKSP